MRIFDQNKEGSWGFQYINLKTYEVIESSVKFYKDGEYLWATKDVISDAIGPRNAKPRGQNKRLEKRKNGKAIKTAKNSNNKGFFAKIKRRWGGTKAKF